MIAANIGRSVSRKRKLMFLHEAVNHDHIVKALLCGGGGVGIRPWLAIHKCFPSHWSDEVMTGRDRSDMILKYVGGCPAIGSPPAQEIRERRASLLH
ncbi:hypothetical protein HNY73_013604 [Argiope bruennichi]|uniref:Uncharacterized protein n=1 Tax=Argiope bruennichi TaxID=94029 RepID=A0A8T0EYL2_ARGBR|nr:hypothetical protein HNY73_013604 [Argiope bruennichi]